MEYDEERELIRFVSKYYSNLFSKHETDILVALNTLDKVLELEREDSRLADEYRSHWKGMVQKAENSALHIDKTEFLKKACDRVIRAFNPKINRCSKCSRIARTPRAEQCLWCGKKNMGHRLST